MDHILLCDAIFLIIQTRKNKGLIMIKKIYILTVASAAILASSTVHAQDAVPPIEAAQPVNTEAPAQAAIVSQDIGNVLKTGTSITLRMMDTLTSKKKKQKVGDRFQLEVAEPVMANNLVIIPAGTRATGEVTLVKKSGMWGKRGRLNARVLYMTLGNRQIRLSGAFDDSGKAGTIGVVGAVAVLPVAGFFVKGSNAEITPGTLVEAFLDEDLTFANPKTQPAAKPVQPIASNAAIVLDSPETQAVETSEAN